MVKKVRGFTLIELMIVLVVITILAAIAIPSYLNQTRKSRRNAAEAALNQIALLEERYRADNSGYLTASSAATWATLAGDPSGTYYTYTVAATAAASGVPSYYTATATAASSQVKDKAQGTSCTPLTYAMVYDSTNNILVPTKGPAAVCWSQ